MGFTREPPAWQGRPGQNHRFHNVSQLQPHHISGVQAKKNIHLATYHSNFQPQQLLPQHHPSLVPTHSYAPSFCNTMTSFDYHTPYPVITHMQVPNGARYFPSRPRPPNYDGTLDSVQMSVSPPNPGSELGSEGYYSPSSLQEQQQQPVYPIFLPGASASNSTYLVPSFQQPHLPMSQQMLDFPSQGNPYYIVPINGSEMPHENGYSGHEDNPGVYRAETNGSFHGDSYIDTNGTSFPYVTATYPAQVNAIPYVRSIHNAGHQHQPVLKNNLPTSGSRDVEQHIQKLCDAAKRFSASFCPRLGEMPYCLPPINRSRHPDKSSKQLVLGVESEKRVLGSFERYFAERHFPVFMLCHYPISGFLHNFNKDVLHSSRDSKSGSFKSSRDTVTLLLLSDQFSITIVMVSVISGNSDFAYIQRGVQKAASHMKRCSLAVSQWLSYLRVSPEVKEVIAFPNLKKAMMQRITKDKQFHQSFGNLCTLHVDDLSAPFEEEWSTPVHKHLFSEWMRTKVRCHPPKLTRDDLQLVVGAMLSPELSSFEHVQGVSSISHIPDTVTYTDTSQETPEDVSQLKLTIDGVTKPFDDFMDEYVKCYYPEVDTKTYRVPPIHFNIQSFKKPSEVETVRERTESETDNEYFTADSHMSSCQEAQSDAQTRRDIMWFEQFSAGPQAEDFDFMPPAKSYKWIAIKDRNCIEHAGPVDREGVMYDDITNDDQWRSGRADSSVAIKNVSNIPTSNFSVNKFSKSSSRGRNKRRIKMPKDCEVVHRIRHQLRSCSQVRIPSPKVL